MSFPVSDHCDGRRFFNPDESAAYGPGAFFSWIVTRRPAPWPKRIEDPPQPAPAASGPGELSVTFLGHASFLLQLGGIRFLCDPVMAGRASPLSFAGPRRVRPFAHPLEALPPIDWLLVSHNHYDHLDPTALKRIAARWNPPTVTGLGTDAILSRCGLSPVTALDWWQAHEAQGVRITYVPARHFSARTPFDRNRALWGGFMIEAGGFTVYFAADTGFGPHFAEIARRFPKIDLALLPIGHYEPRLLMAPVHVNPAEAAEAHRILKPTRSIGMHFGSFEGLTDEAIDAPEQALKQALQHGEAFDTMAHGETRVFR